MVIEHAVGFAFCVFVLVVLASLVSEKFRLSETLVLLVLGAVVGGIITSGLNLDTGIRSESFHDLVFFVFLPVLVFDASLKLPQQAVLKDGVLIGFLALAGVGITAVVAGYLIFIGVGHPSGFPFIAALLTGTLLAATDPVSVVSQLKSLGAPERLRVLLEGESLFNDATAIALFSVLMVVALDSQASVSGLDILGSLSVNFLGGAAIGIGVGLLGGVAFRHIDDQVIRAIAGLAVAYGSFIFAEEVIHVSGILAVTAAGMTVARIAGSQGDSFGAVWQSLTRLADGTIFLLMGLVVGWYMFEQRWLAMLIAIGAVTVTRLFVTVGGISFFNLFLARKLPLNYQTALVWGGLRGAVSLALALSIPVDLPYWFTIQCMAFGVVLFTMLVQAPTLPPLLSRLGLVQR